MTIRDSVTVSVPATTANLGPGFDCLGLALDLRTTVTLEQVEGRDFTVEIVGEGSDILPWDTTNSIAKAVLRTFKRAEFTPEAGLKLSNENRVPVSSGLGSSAAAIAVGVTASNKLMGEPFSPMEMLEIAVELEGHPDNVAPALFGGLVISSMAEGALLSRRVDIQPLEVVIALPEFKVTTEVMREALPAYVPFKDASANLGRTALVVEALRTGDMDLLRGAMIDNLHIPYRKDLIPGYEMVEVAALDAGAAAVTLSGAGPSIAAFASENHFEIAATMRDAFAMAGLRARSWVLPVDFDGAIEV